MVNITSCDRLGFNSQYPHESSPPPWAPGTYIIHRKTLLHIKKMKGTSHQLVLKDTYRHVRDDSVLKSTAVSVVDSGLVSRTHVAQPPVSPVSGESVSLFWTR